MSIILIIINKSVIVGINFLNYQLNIFLDFFSAGTTGNNVSVDECSGEVSIRCSDLNTNENCTINYQQDGMDFIKTIPPLTLVSFPLEIEQFQVVIKNGSVVLHQSFGVLNGK